MKTILKDEFEKIFPILEEVYNHSKHRVKLWEQTVTKKKVVDNWEKEVDKYWKSIEEE